MAHVGRTNKELLMDQRTQILAENIVRIGSAAKRMIFVTFQKEGLHFYPMAPVTGDEYDVQFLRYEHRHIFHFRVDIEVFNNDRDIEFIQFKRWCESLYSDKTLDMNSKSCEMISDDLYKQIAIRYPDRDVQIEVSEDRENGCTIFYNRFRPVQQLAI